MELLVAGGPIQTDASQGAQFEGLLRGFGPGFSGILCLERWAKRLKGLTFEAAMTQDPAYRDEGPYRPRRPRPRSLRS